MIESPVRNEIMRRLAAAESGHGVRILYACESGSRAWDFASPDSDYEVRFIYARDVDSYLSFDVEDHHDVIEYPIVEEIDCNGWDLRKALHLATRTNGVLLNPVALCRTQFGCTQAADARTGHGCANTRAG